MSEVRFVQHARPDALGSTESWLSYTSCSEVRFVPCFWSHLLAELAVLGSPTTMERCLVAVSAEDRHGLQTNGILFTSSFFRKLLMTCPKAGAGRSSQFPFCRFTDSFCYSDGGCLMPWSSNGKQAA